MQAGSVPSVRRRCAHIPSIVSAAREAADEDVTRIVAYISWLRAEKDGTGDARQSGARISTSRIERGEWLFEVSGCTACHGLGGATGMPNRNSRRDSVPSLVDLGPRLGLRDASSRAAASVADVESILAYLIGLSGTTPEDPPPTP